ncbi:hypothetical protein INR49_000451 [Caranx melampygus]|nr:hypothetical protein INR49_000451 [Caranx melampygus]
MQSALLGSAGFNNHSKQIVLALTCIGSLLVETFLRNATSLLVFISLIQLEKLCKMHYE